RFCRHDPKRSRPMSPSFRPYSRRAAMRHGAQLAGRAGLGLAALQGMAGVAGAASSPMGVVDQLVAAQLAFGFRLHGALAPAASGGNLLISPLSVALALSMTYNGARGSTQSAMARTLGIGALPTADLN